jgi:hypothetical protein
MTGSLLVIVGGVALDGFGVSVLAIGAGLVAFAPIPFLLVIKQR